MRTIRQSKFLSIMIPTRSRFNKLNATIGTFLAQLNAEQRGEIEFIVRFDSDDHESVSQIGALPFGEVAIQVIVGDKLGGYKDLYHFYNECAKLSFGQYLLMWNDDAQFKTPDWYSILKSKASSDVSAHSYWFGGTPTLVREPGKPDRTEDWPCFVAQHRLFYQIMGIYGDLGGVDSFLYYTLGPLGLLTKIEEIQVNHLAWFQIDPKDRDTTAHMNSQPGAMLPTDFNVVRQCQERLTRAAQQQAQRK